jgi:endonuclease YncB( thermonuclease family)
MLLTFPLTAYAHGGGLDGLGCHHNRKLGGYHCHRGELAGQSFSSKAEAQGIRQPPPESLEGTPLVIDGDTIEVAGQRIRLHGIDAPEWEQTCTKGAEQYSCGQAATTALKEMVADREVNCQGKDVDRYGRIVAVCSVGETDINARMAVLGWALAYRRYSMDYVDEEATAEVSRSGMWAGEFMKPWEWRHNR